MKSIIILSLSLIFISGCIHIGPPDCTSPPEQFLLRIHDPKNVDLLSPQLLGNFSDSLALYSINNGHSGYDTVKTTITSYTDANQKTTYQLNGYLASGMKTYYLRRSHATIDTISADFEVKLTGNCGQAIIMSAKYNGEVLAQQSDNTGYYYQAVGQDPK